MSDFEQQLLAIVASKKISDLGQPIEDCLNHYGVDKSYKCSSFGIIDSHLGFSLIMKNFCLTFNIFTKEVTLRLPGMLIGDKKHLNCTLIDVIGFYEPKSLIKSAR